MQDDATQPKPWERALATLDQKGGYFYEEEPTWMWQALRSTTIPPPPPERVDLDRVVKSITERPPEPLCEPLPPRRAKVDRRAFEVSMAINVALGLAVVACLGFVLLRPERVVHTPIMVEAIAPGPSVEWPDPDELPEGVDPPIAAGALAPLGTALPSSVESVEEPTPQLIVMPPVRIQVPATRLAANPATSQPPDQAANEAAPAAQPVTPTPAPPAPGLPERPSRVDVAVAMDRVAPGIRACAEGLGGERVHLFFHFRSNGTVRSALVEGTRAAPDQRSCMARAAREASVPPFAQDSLSVRYPFTL